MQPERGRAKKLIVAFHFLCVTGQPGAQFAGWTCGQCRRQRLEAIRRCGWLSEERRGPKRLVWAKGRVATDECPKSFIRPESLGWMELFFAWKADGGGVMNIAAKDVDALLVLEREWREANHGVEQSN